MFWTEQKQRYQDSGNYRPAKKVGWKKITTVIYLLIYTYMYLFIFNKQMKLNWLYEVLFLRDCLQIYCLQLDFLRMFCAKFGWIGKNISCMLFWDKFYQNISDNHVNHSNYFCVSRRHSWNCGIKDDRRFFQRLPGFLRWNDDS